MNRRRLFAALCLAAAAAAAAPVARAHFVFVVPTADGRHAQVILSEDLKPDPDVPPDLLTAARLTCTDGAGHDADVLLTKGDHAYAADLPGTGTRVVHGTCDVGVRTREGPKPYLLVYHPKTIVGDAFDPATKVGAATPVELVPVRAADGFKLRLSADGKPVVGATVTVVPPDGEDRRETTDAAGETPPLAGVGRFGAWAKTVDPTPGDRDGKHYDEVRHYATLVADVPAPPATQPTTKPVAASRFAPMPQAAASFGAVAAGGWLYVYGGHVAPTHKYSTDSVSGQFHRLNLADGKTWESLPAGPPLQGMNLAAWNGRVIRAGGMRPWNAAGQPDDVWSSADASAYNPAAGVWAPLPPLPGPRSSHDLAVVGDKLYVVGGWQLAGDASDGRYADTALVLDLAAATPTWREFKQPFQRRALTAAVHGGKVYVLGGFDGNDDPSLRVDVLDPATEAWSAGPALPAAAGKVPEMNGFGPAACAAGDDLLVSLGDGSLHRLDDAKGRWVEVAKTTPRIVHRMVADVPGVLILGGAAGVKQLDLIESVRVR